MEKFSTPLVEHTKEYVAEFIAENFTEKICYHNIDHTMEVVEATEIIGRKCKISDKDLETVIISAWFHDVGYFMGCENHERASAKIAEEYLKRENVDTERIIQVKQCILSTKIPQKPKTLLDKILCDADLYHLATEKFFEKSQLLWREFSLHNKDITPKYWLNQSKDFVEAHEYHTSFGKHKLLPKLEKNLTLIKDKIKQFEL